jgi:hypothetical protein
MGKRRTWIESLEEVCWLVTLIMDGIKRWGEDNFHDFSILSGFYEFCRTQY